MEWIHCSFDIKTFMFNLISSSQNPKCTGVQLRKPKLIRNRNYEIKETKVQNKKSKLLIIETKFQKK